MADKGNPNEGFDKQNQPNGEAENNAQPPQASIGAYNTDMLIRQMESGESISAVIRKNEASFVEGELHEYLEKEIEKRKEAEQKKQDEGEASAEKRKSVQEQLIEDTGINRRFFFQIMKGERHPHRDNVIRFILALQMPLERAQRLLRVAGYAELFARRKRDAIIIKSIIEEKSVDEWIKELHKHGEQGL